MILNANFFCYRKKHFFTSIYFVSKVLKYHDQSKLIDRKTLSGKEMQQCKKIRFVKGYKINAA